MAVMAKFSLSFPPVQRQDLRIRTIIMRGESLFGLTCRLYRLNCAIAAQSAAKLLLNNGFNVF
jgi:hypothetical protein